MICNDRLGKKVSGVSYRADRPHSPKNNRAFSSNTLFFFVKEGKHVLQLPLVINIETTSNHYLIEPATSRLPGGNVCAW